MNRFLWLALILGCETKSVDDTGVPTDTSDTADTGETPLSQDELFAKWINVTDAAVGDLTCYDGVNWNTETPDPSCQTVAPIGEGQVNDFANNAPVGGASVAYYFGDAISGTPGLTATADADGYVTGELPECRAVAYQVTTSDGRAQDTYEFHVIYGAGATVNPDLISVLSDTYVAIPSLLGVTIQAGEGVVAGEARDCNGDDIQNAQVILRDSAGDIPQDLRMGFTQGGVPLRALTATTEDGVWIAMNVPPGDYTALLYISDGAGGQTLVGEAAVSAFGDSVSIVVVHGGNEDGLDYPDSCMTCAG